MTGMADRRGISFRDSAITFLAMTGAVALLAVVLLVLLDDVGYGWSSAFGGLVEMPTAERLRNSWM